VVRSIAYNGASAAQPAEKLVELIANEVDVVVVCPSNPYLSIDPILATPGLRAALRHTSAAVVAVSPLIAGHAIKGPTAKLMLELGVDVSSETIARHYDDLIDGFVLDPVDSHLTVQMRCAVHVTPTLMTDLASKKSLAIAVLEFGESLLRRTG
jgi:LPPG:FO 2-phospho-L-lactate transferase